MAGKEHDGFDGDGKRLCLPFLGDSVYLVGTRAADGGIDYLAAVPHENRPENLRERMIVDKILEACGQLSRMV